MNDESRVRQYWVRDRGLIICGMLRLRPMISKAREKLRGVADISGECLGYNLIEMSCLVASSKALDLRRMSGEKFE